MLNFLGFLLLSPLFAQEKIHVQNFTPQGYAKSVEQIRIEFSQSMVRFGDIHLAAPAKSDCFKAGQGRWLDTKNWVFDFSNPLPGGTQCKVEVLGKIFQFNTGGPGIKETFPRQYRPIEPDQNFILVTDVPVNKKTVEEKAYFVVDGLGDRIGVTVLDSGTEKILDAAKEEFKYEKEAFDGEKIYLKAQRPFPPGAKVSLIWGKGVESKSGASSPAEETFEFSVAEAFKAEFSCSREAISKPCIPLLGMNLSLNSSISLQDAKKIYLQSKNQKRIEPEISDDEVKMSYLSFKGPFLADSEYTLFIPSPLKDEDGRVLTNQSQFPLKIKTGENPSLLKFAANFGVVESGPEAALAVTLRRVEKSLQNKFYGFSGRFESGKFKEIIHILNEVQRNPDGNTKSEILKKLKATSLLVQKPLKASETEVVGIPLKQNGFYFIEMQSSLLGDSLLNEKKPFFVRSTALVTGMAVHLKYNENEAWIWVTDLKSAEVVPQAKVTLFDVSGSPAMQATTDRRGIAYVRFKTPLKDWIKKDDSFYYDGFFAVAEKGNDFSFVHSSWSQGIESWRYQIGYQDSVEPLIAHGILDRTLFKPEETMSGKIILRTTEMGKLKIPGTKEFPSELSISHDSGLQSFKLPLKWDTKLGSTTVSFQLPSGIKMGRWSLSLLRGKESPIAVGGFSVESFRVPLVQVSLSSKYPFFVQEKDVVIDVGGKYFAGGPASGQKMKMRWSVEPSTFDVQDDDLLDFSFANGSVKEGLYRSGEDEGARYISQSGAEEFSLNEQGQKEFTVKRLKYGSGPQRLRTEVEYKDPNGEIQSVIRSFMMWPSGAVLGIKAKSWWTRPDNVEFDVVALDLQQNPLKYQKVTVDLYTSKYYSHRKRLVGGFYAYEDFREYKKVAELCQGETNAKGIFACAGKSKVSGTVLAVAHTKDSEGRESFANVSHWIIKENSPQWFGSDDNDRADLIPFKKAYEPGEVAELQLRTPFKHSKVLVTVEREGVLSSEVVDVNGDKPVIRVPIKKEYAPNAVISAFAIRERISEPLPTALVDLGKPALKLGMTSIKVGWKHHALNVDVTSDRKSYKVREKVNVTVKVKDSNGKPVQGEVILVAVDEGLLELRDNNSWDILNAMMQPRPHLVNTASGQTLVIGKRHFGLKAVPIGGDGGGALRRELFDTLLYWNPSLQLDKNGTAKVQIPLNDSVTSFKIVAIALSGSDQFGHGWTSIQSSQDIMILPGLSGVVREGDQFKATFTVRNTTSQIQELNLSLKVNGKGTSDQKIKLGPGEAKESFWMVFAEEEKLEYLLTARNLQGKVVDEVKKTQKVLSLREPRIVQSQWGPWPDFKSLNLQQPFGAIANKSSVIVEVSESIGASETGMKDYWKNYPYSCLEQLVSRAISLNDKRAWSKIEEKLSTYTDANGLLRYFANDNSRGSVVLTAYILSVAHEAGFKLSQENETRLVEGLENYSQGRIKEENKIQSMDEPLKRVTVLETLSRYRKLKPDQITTVQDQLQQWPLYTLVEWFQIYQREKNLPQREAKLKEIDAQIRSRLIVTAKRMQLKSDRRENTPWLMRDADSSSVRLLLAVKDLPEWKTDVPRLYSSALSTQKQGAWLLTTANAWGALANRRIKELYAKEKVQGSLTVKLEKEKVTHDWKKPLGTYELSWREKSSEISWQQTGAGKPWVTVSAKAAIPSTKSVFAGLRVEKTIQPLEQKKKGLWSVGDTALIKVKVKSAAPQAWVVLEDSFPAGASVLSSSYATAVERKEELVRFYQEYFSGEETFEYSIRFNQAGSYQLSAPHAEVMYSPDIFADLPESQWKVEE